MNLNYAIFKSEPIMNPNDLSQIGSHNKREKKTYQSNSDNDITKSKDNIELVPLAEKYLKGFDIISHRSKFCVYISILTPHKRLTDKGYDLGRGIKGSDNKHIKIKECKRVTRKLNQELNVKNDRLDKAMNDFVEKMKATKESFLVGKDYAKVKKDTFDSMNNVIKESKKVMEMQPKL